MGHTPFGYRIENGKAVIDEAAAAHVRDLYKNYLSGLWVTLLSAVSPGVAVSAVNLYIPGVIFGDFLPCKPRFKVGWYCG